MPLAVQDPNADEHGSTCLLIFKAGPPYEDIAFKILNKEWEYSHKKGFKSTLSAAFCTYTSTSSATATGGDLLGSAVGRET